MGKGTLAPHPALERAMAETIVGCPPLRVLQHIIRFVDFLEFLF